MDWFVVSAGLRASLAHKILSAFLSRHASAYGTVGGAVLLAGEAYHGRMTNQEEIASEFAALNTRIALVVSEIHEVKNGVHKLEYGVHKLENEVHEVKNLVGTGLGMIYTLMQAVVAKDTKPAQDCINAIAASQSRCKETRKDCGDIGLVKISG